MCGLAVTLLPLIAWGWACQAPQIEAHTDRQAYVLGSRDSVGIVQLAVQNRGAHAIYLQTADGRADIVVLIRVDARGKIMVGADTAGPEIWSLFLTHPNPNLRPAMSVVRLAPDSVFASTYSLPRGHYRTLVHFGTGPEKLDQNGLWLPRFAIR